MTSNFLRSTDIYPDPILYGLGHQLVGKSGKEYLDFFCDNGVITYGYQPAGLQQKLYDHSPHMPQTLEYPKREEIIARFAKLTNMDKVFVTTGGSEANELMIKMIRIWNRKVNAHPEDKWFIYCYKGGYHGRTYGSLSASDSASYHKQYLNPLLPGFKYFSEVHEINWDECAGVMLASVYGYNDTWTYSHNFMEQLRILTRNNNVPLALDEVQSGAGRTGRFSAYEHYGFEPDMACYAKGIGAGIPIGLVTMKKDIANLFDAGVHYNTFGGNIWGLLGVEYVMDKWESQANNIMEGSEWFVDCLQKIPEIKEIRNIGMMFAIEFEEPIAKQVSRYCYDAGLFIPTFRERVIKMAPALDTSDNEFSFAADKINKAIKKCQ